MANLQSNKILVLEVDADADRLIFLRLDTTGWKAYQTSDVKHLLLSELVSLVYHVNKYDFLYCLAQYIINKRGFYPYCVAKSLQQPAAPSGGFSPGLLVPDVLLNPLLPVKPLIPSHRHIATIVCALLFKGRSALRGSSNIAHTMLFRYLQSFGPNFNLARSDYKYSPENVENEVQMIQSFMIRGASER
ncbi:uncharacterized protein BDR25DRAFT_353473 [Lindgomyces ingoldianus]|uniref:Uncharacterized protein n=1 Tax=Lindgomyces ingoldianus TaxID=673940 RepID=A0ACB6QZV1_9PLEO|nr:uncharacterized protein BDR25DRAFT_353473 [Lindgomyces ingoldianus]KAF2472456.1 hypothetical protein BDR25DRAFT_353473 [Lindgomyces ingoldianus]